MESMYERKYVGYDTRSCRDCGILDGYGYKRSYACSSHYFLTGRIRYINVKMTTASHQSRGCHF